MFSIFFLTQAGSPLSADTTVSSNSFLLNFMSIDSPRLFLPFDSNKGAPRTQVLCRSSVSFPLTSPSSLQYFGRRVASEDDTQTRGRILWNARLYAARRYFQTGSRAWQRKTGRYDDGQDAEGSDGCLQRPCERQSSGNRRHGP